MSEGHTERLLELDPELGRLLGEQQRALALDRLHVEVMNVAPGGWDAARAIDELEPEPVALLVLEGVLARELHVEDTVSAELLGPGDVLRPWQGGDGHRLLPHRVRWTVLSPLRLAVLDRPFAIRAGAWPEINLVLIDRLNSRAQRLATTQAISQLNGVDRRVVALLWHLAERWGRMTRDGVLVPLELSHRVLSRLVGARRPSVSTAVATLVRRGELARHEDGSWLLRGEPTGKPEATAERIVPIRRRLIGSEAPAAVDEVAGPATHLRLLRARSEHAELQADAGRLEGDLRSRLEALMAATSESKRLLAEARRRQAERQAG